MNRSVCGVCLALALLGAPGLARQPEKDKLFDRKTVAQWAEDLSSKDVETRLLAAIALSKAKAAAAPAVKELTAAAQDRDDRVSLYCVRTLGQLGRSGRTAVPTLVRILTGAAANRSRNAALALGQIGKDSVEPLLKALTDESPRARALAAFALGLI